MFVNLRLSSTAGTNIRSRVNDLSEVLNYNGYVSCEKAFQGTYYSNKLPDKLKDYESDTLVSVITVFALFPYEVGDNPALYCHICELKSRTNSAVTITVEVDECGLGYLTLLCRWLISNSTLIDKVRIYPDMSDPETKRLLSGVETVIKRDKEERQ